jgi:type IV pilus assembly protein PilM
MFKFPNGLNFSSLLSLGAGDGFVALDIGSSSVKMVESSIEKSRYYQLLNLGTAPLPPKAIQNNMVVDQRSVVDAIRRVVQEHNVKAKNVISAVPGRAAIMK